MDKKNLGTMGPGIDFPLIMSYKDTENPSFEPYYYFLNGHNGVVYFAASNFMEEKTESYDYNPWGVLLKQASKNSLLYTARDFNFDINLQFNRMRYYNPNIRRFCQSDLIFLKMNRFNYSKNPVNYTDPIGLYGDFVLPMMEPNDNWGVTGCIIYRDACIRAYFMPEHCRWVKKENEADEYYYDCECATPQ